MKTHPIFHRLLILLVGLSVLFGILAPLDVTASPAAQTRSQPEVEAEVLDQTRGDQTTHYWIEFGNQPDLSAAYQMGWEERGQYVYDQLTAAAERSQARVIAYLESQGITHTAYWINNAIYVEQSGRATINALLNFEEIELIRAPREVFLHEPVAEPASQVRLNAVEPNLTRIQAPAAWGLGYTGTGLVVANIDTGVRYTHAAVVNQYRGNLGGGSFNHDYNWRDPAFGGSSPTPYDHNGHGTHTMGTILGDDGGANQIGVAPGAKWIACLAFQGSDAELVDCGQWMLAPTKVDGTLPDATKRPHVINNSWGDCLTSYDSWYQATITAWHAAGIYPVFSNGNAGNCGYSNPPGLNTVGNPARYGNVTGVGSTGQSNGAYATHSNWGPTDNLDTVNPTPGFANLKPQVLAPGVSIRSAMNGNDTQYAPLTGTSMSAPHVTGLIALMWQAAPCLVGNYATTETLIEDSATAMVYDDGSALTPTNFPNFATGWGEINALAAVQAATAYCSGADSTLQGTVTGLGVCNVPPAVALTAATIQVYTTGGSPSLVATFTTNPSGQYSGAVTAGTYRLVASKTGYVSAEAQVTVASGATRTTNFELASAEPCVQVTPGVLDISLFPNRTGIRSLTLTNSGATAGSFQIIETNNALLAAELLQDGSFELGTGGSSPWGQYSLRFGTPLCTQDGCGLGGGTAGPRTGSWWSWFGGAGGAGPEYAWLTQSVTIPAGGNAQLSFYSRFSVCGNAADYLSVEVDGSEVWRQHASGPRCGETEYQQSVVDLSAYADGGVHEIRFYGIQSTTANTNMNLDDVSLMYEADIPWMSVAPASGSVPGGSSLDVIVTFDSTGLALGDYQAYLRLYRDPHDPIQVPVSLHVVNQIKVFMPLVKR